MVLLIQTWNTFSHNFFSLSWKHFFFLLCPSIFSFSISRLSFLSWTRKKILQHFSNIFFYFFYFLLFSTSTLLQSDLWMGTQTELLHNLSPLSFSLYPFQVWKVKKKTSKQYCFGYESHHFPQCWKRVSMDQCLIHLNKWIIDNTLKLIN